MILMGGKPLMTKLNVTMGPIKTHLMNILTMHSDKAFILHTNLCVVLVI